MGLQKGEDDGMDDGGKREREGELGLEQLEIPEPLCLLMRAEFT